MPHDFARGCSWQERGLLSRISIRERKGGVFKSRFSLNRQRCDSPAACPPPDLNRIACILLIPLRGFRQVSVGLDFCIHRAETDTSLGMCVLQEASEAAGNRWPLVRFPDHQAGLGCEFKHFFTPLHGCVPNREAAWPTRSFPLRLRVNQVLVVSYLPVSLLSGLFVYLLFFNFES